MSDITINNDKNQDENQKTTPVTESSLESNSSSIYSSGDVLQIWLGMRDSNPRMTGPEPVALPLGQSPMSNIIIANLHSRLYTTYSVEHCKNTPYTIL